MILSTSKPASSHTAPSGRCGVTAVCPKHWRSLQVNVERSLTEPQCDCHSQDLVPKPEGEPLGGAKEQSQKDKKTKRSSIWNSPLLKMDGGPAGPADQDNKERNRERLQMGLSTCLFQTQTHGKAMSSKAQPDITL